ncbi:hypothetical protein [Sphingomonas sp.]|uniref:hypothetical protein n=1 Tax=Sphingomonas sp. TaxID=28214 RepID=UPI0025F4C521|nr:hypothetical protein [Sphingomonas sp.]
MIDFLLAFAALAVATPQAPPAAKHSRPPAAKSAKKPAPRASATVKLDLTQSAAATRVIDWVAASGDNGALPYIVIDKNNAAAFLFDATGQAVAKAPVLVGVAVGDEATPGIGSKNLAEIGPAEKTTPAGRFLAKYGIAAGRQKVLWVDYATSVALHPIPVGYNPKERRRERMASPAPGDHRITFGCINVPSTFYSKSVQPLFRKKGGYVYILPDTKPIETVFPLLLGQAVASGGSR